MAIPEARLPQHLGQGFIGVIKGPVETVEKPVDPIGDVEISLLCSLKHVVISTAFDADLSRHTIEALRRMF